MSWLNDAEKARKLKQVSDEERSRREEIQREVISGQILGILREVGAFWGTFVDQPGSIRPRNREEIGTESWKRWDNGKWFTIMRQGSTRISFICWTGMQRGICSLQGEHGRIEVRLSSGLSPVLSFDNYNYQAYSTVDKMKSAIASAWASGLIIRTRYRGYDLFDSDVFDSWW